MIFAIDRKNKNAPALCADNGVQVTYGELKREAERMGTIFHRGRPPVYADDSRCLVFCMCKNAPGAVTGYVAMLENGAVPLLLDEHLPREQFRSFYLTYRPSHIWAPAGWEETMEGAVGEKVYEAYEYVLWKTSFSRCPMYRELALLLATSGSTGSPRLVRVSRENISSNTAVIAQYLRLDAANRPVTTLPMHYTYGLSVINSHLLAGACILLTAQSYVQNGFWDFFDRERATSFSGVPYTYEILRRMHVFEKDLPTLKCMTQAGGKLSEELQRLVGLWAKERGIDFYLMYGQTEATARMSYLAPEKCLEKIGSIGKAVSGGRFWLRDECGREIKEADTSGELIYSGNNVTLGYAKGRGDLLLGDERCGTLDTGDLAKRDAEGYYYIIGRKKRFVKLFGVRVSLDACERLLAAHFSDAEFACAGEDGHLEIYTDSLAAADAAAGYLADRLQLNRKGFVCRYIPGIPKNAAGKTQYAVLEAAARATERREGETDGI